MTRQFATKWLAKTKLATAVTMLAMGAAGCAPALAGGEPALAKENKHARPPVTVRAYAVPEGSEEGYRSMAHKLLRGDSDQRELGRVAIAPGGRVVVAAPEAIHDIIAPLFAPVEDTDGKPSNVSVTYWVVAAKPAPERQSEPALSTIDASLSAISERDGGLHFRLLDVVAVQSSSESRASHRGQRTFVDQSLHTRDGLLLADFGIETDAANVGPLRTRMAIQPNAAVVIGETFVDGDEDERLIYVVRATVQ